MATILIIDDDPNILEGLEDILGAAGYAVATAATGADALVILQQHSVDLAIIDYQLPDGSGLELAPQMHLLQPRLKILMMTGMSAGDLAEDIPGGPNREGIIDFLTKPVSPEHLLDILADSLR